MNKLPCPSRQFGATLISLFLCFGSALAQQAPGKQGAAQTVPAAMVVRPGEYFTEAQRRAIQDYYAGHRSRTGRCPPGLAKKNNGCLPPGQAKKWAMGRPLPSGVIYQSLPEEIFRRIGLPPRELEIVRILNDILVLHRGNRLVLDAVEILGQP